MSPVAIRTSNSTIPLETGSARVWQLLVGVNQYLDKQIACLNYSSQDCQGLADALQQATQGFPQKQVMVHHDFTTQLPYLEAVRSSLRKIATSAKPQDTVIFYFSGHGIIDSTTRVVLCLQDTHKDNLGATGLTLQELLQTLESCPAQQQVVWLDACHSGGMTLFGAKGDKKIESPTSELVNLLRQRAAKSKGFYALLSCDQDQLSWEFPELEHGLFTYYLMQGLLGDAADTQGVIDADGLYKYVYQQTLSYIDKTNQQLRLINQQNRSIGITEAYQEYSLQTPKRIVEGVGQLILGLKSSKGIQHPKRKALVIEGLPPSDACQGIIKILRADGGFEVDYLFQPETSADLRSSISKLLELKDGAVLLYLRANLKVTPEGQTLLELSPTLKMTRSWLKKQLQKIPNVQQIIILDCPHVQTLHVETLHVTSLQQHLREWVEDLQMNHDKGQCVIAASPRENLEQFTNILFSTLNESRKHASGLTVASWITQLQTLAINKIKLYFWLWGTKGIIEILLNQTLFTRDSVNIDISIDCGANYQKLHDLLKAGKWQEANNETTKLLELTHQKYLQPEDINNLPYQDINTIDSLWVKYSGGRFGFSVQKQIWESLKSTKANDYVLAIVIGNDNVKFGETGIDFANRVGWRLKDNWLDYDYLNFSLDAPTGHLPFFNFIENPWRIKVLGIWEMNSMILTARWWQKCVCLFERLDNCH
ncbi:peptidase C14 caspase catalytic subunit p20 [Calothrix sp. NIES-4071]|nr:peptidase C14 caspase catalytic subunit p20 [Calothrix sp. NIES-4071]BAZ57161.1 peptidase C14 caspase catalytic subunit p20 [Calothrix sp. NIES-4105]